MPSDAGVLSLIPPWLLLAALLGTINGAACFALIGRRVRHLAWYAALGALAAGVGQVLGLALQAPAPLAIGELNLLAASLAAWAIVGSARAVGL